MSGSPTHLLLEVRRGTCLGRPLYDHLDLPKVVVLDAVFYNLALILQSHLRTGKGKVSTQQ